MHAHTHIRIVRGAFSSADMTKNKGFLMLAPNEISVQRKQVKEIIFSLLPACTEPDLDTGTPFRAQAIIANPPALGGSVRHYTPLFHVVTFLYTFANSVNMFSKKNTCKFSLVVWLDGAVYTSVYGI
jgi:hypothetical protein